jgi:hypothetical protein
MARDGMKAVEEPDKRRQTVLSRVKGSAASSQTGCRRWGWGTWRVSGRVQSMDQRRRVNLGIENWF